MSRQRVRTVLLAVAALVAVALLVVSVHSQYGDVRARLHELTVVAVLASVLAAVLAGGATMLSWRALLTDLGSPLPLRAATGVFFLGQLGKYIPGSVWSVLGQMELARTHGVPRTRAATASALALVVSLLCGLLVAGALLPELAPHAAADYWPVFLALPVALVALAPPVLSRLVGLALRLARRAPLEQSVTGAGIGRAVCFSLVAWACWGAGLWVLARDEGVGGPRALAVCIGAFGLAWVAGFLVVFVPAGAGIREAVLVAVLTSALALPGGAPLLIALVSRLTLTAADVLLGLLALPFARRTLHAPTAGGRPGPADPLVGSPADVAPSTAAAPGGRR